MSEKYSIYLCVVSYSLFICLQVSVCVLSFKSKLTIHLFNRKMTEVFNTSVCSGPFL